jgi:hypothetical protein
MPLKRHEIDVLSELREVMAMRHTSKHKLNPRRSGNLPDLESVLRKQQLIAFVVLLILASIVGIVIGL